MGKLIGHNMMNGKSLLVMRKAFFIALATSCAMIVITGAYGFGIVKPSDHVMLAPDGAACPSWMRLANLLPGNCANAFSRLLASFGVVLPLRSDGGATFPGRETVSEQQFLESALVDTQLGAKGAVGLVALDVFRQQQVSNGSTKVLFKPLLYLAYAIFVAAPIAATLPVVFVALRNLEMLATYGANLGDFLSVSKAGATNRTELVPGIMKVREFLTAILADARSVAPRCKGISEQLATFSGAKLAFCRGHSVERLATLPTNNCDWHDKIPPIRDDTHNIVCGEGPAWGPGFSGKLIRLSLSLKPVYHGIGKYASVVVE